MSTATLDRTASSIGAGGFRRIWSATTAFFASVDLAIARSHEVQRLMALPDAALARRGLTRDGIVQHVMAALPD